MGLFNKIKSVFSKDKDIVKYDEALTKTRKEFSTKISDLSKKYKNIGEDYFEELEDILIMADIGINTVMKFVDKLKKRAKEENIKDTDTLKEIIVEDGRMGWKWSVKIAKQIAQALETAHRNNIIHRDIKPHNIIITEDGTAKVTDFGIAKAVSNSTITAFGTTIGSVHYFSPEHARGGYTDAKSDLYSLGVVLYEMVTGRVPFDADTPVSVALKHMQEKPVPPIELNPAIPQSLNDLILKAMEKDPNMRYSTATEMIEDLDKILKNPEAEVGVVDKSQARARRIQQEENQTNQSKFAKLKKYLEEHKGVKIALIVAIFLIVFIASIGITLGVLNSGKPKDILLPNFTNLTLDEAKAKAEEVKLNLNVSEEKYDVQIEEGKIISQDPKYQPNYTVKEGSTVNVVVSKGQEIVKVTKLVGKTKDEARKELKDLGLEMEIEEVNSDDVEPGIVIEQDKQEGEEVLAGTKIKLKVSLGIEKVEVPDLTGLSEDEAKAKITEAKLKWIRTDKIKDSGKGTGVVEQNISPKSMVDKNTEISITINEYQKITQGTINIDVAALTGYTPKYKKVEDGKDEDGKTKYKDVLIPPEKVKIKVTVNDEQVTEQEVSEDEKALQVNFDGEGTVRIKVIIDGSTKKTVDMNLNSETTKNIP